MKRVVSTLVLGVVIFTTTYAQKNNREMEMEVKQTVLAFDGATATRDIATLQKVLHPDYRVLANRFRGTPGTTVIMRDTYLSLMENGKVGGRVYEPEFRQINVTGHTAMVDLLLKTKGVASMHKYLFLVQNDKNEWQVISDLPVVME